MKGYELIKQIAEGNIKDNTKIEVHELFILDKIITTITYKNGRLDWKEGTFSTEYLCDNSYYFKIVEDEINIQEIKKINYNDNFYRTDNIGKLNELVQAVKQLDKKVKGE